MNHPLRNLIIPVVVAVLAMPAIVAAQTPVAPPPGGEWWTAWSSCAITPVEYGPGPEDISGTPDAFFWLQGEGTNDSGINMIVWLWTGDRPLPTGGQYASDGSFTKWLWAFSEPMADISAVVTNEDGAQGEVQFGGEILGSSTGPINGWPSYAVVPVEGCWTFDITATAESGEVYNGQVVFPAVP